MSADFDFLERNGDCAVILGSGEHREPEEEARLPRDAGIHLVAGTAQRGGLRTVGTVPRGRHFLSSNYRWLGVQDETEPTVLRLFDTKNRCRSGFVFEVPATSKAVALHPSGEMVACRDSDDLTLLLPDGKELARSMSFSRPVEDWHNEEILFSPCGRYLWFTHNDPREKNLLFLLRCPSLEVLDYTYPAYDESNCYDSDRSWLEVVAAPNPATNHIAIRRQIGDDFLTLNCYSARRDRIQLHEPHVYSTDDIIPGETVAVPQFAANGKQFLLLDSDGHLHEFVFPDCENLFTVHDSSLRSNEWQDFRDYGYSGRYVLATLEEALPWTIKRQRSWELVALRAGNLTRFSLLSLGEAVAVLPNGMVLTAGPREDEQEVRTFHLQPRSLPVVAELDSAINRVRKVYHKQQSAWCDITAEVGWVELNFRLEAY